MMELRVLVVCVALVVSVQASCHNGRSTTAEDGRTVCETHGVTLEVGETKVTDDCFRCTCYLSGYNCCGVGRYAGKGEVPEGHIQVDDDNCEFHFERIDQN